MGLMQQAYDTYCYAEKQYAGVYHAGQTAPLAPVGHVITKAAIEITLDETGRCLSAAAVPAGEERTIFPATEESAGRAGSSPAAHPLCEQLQYLMVSNTEKYEFYVNQLSQWAASPHSHPALQPVLHYVRGNTILQDLMQADLIALDADGKPKNDKSFIRWRIEGIGPESGACWTNRHLQQAFMEWYAADEDRKTALCMLSGQEAYAAKQHAKGIVSRNANAKLISANDNAGFTYRGRFQSKDEALTVSYDASQKAHSALRWLIDNQGEYFGSSGRCLVCWNPKGKVLPKPTGVMARKKENAASYTPTQYQDQLKKIVAGWKQAFPADEKAVTAVFDAATNGRLSLVYYSEYQAADFVDRLAYWEETCCWNSRNFGIQSPSLYKIALYACGNLRGNGFEADDAIFRQVFLRLLECRIEKAKIPTALALNLTSRAGNLQILPNDEASRYLRDDILFTACAVIRKKYIDNKGEEWEMALEPQKKDRSYQFGRWMAIMEKIERDTYDSDTREPNIIRRQMAFVARPYATAVSVMGQIKTAYYPQLGIGARQYYEQLIEDIMLQLSEFEQDLNRQLTDTYLLGYYLQKKDLYTKKSEKVEE